MRRSVNNLLLAVFVAADMVASRWVGQQAYSWMPIQGTTEAQHVDSLFSFLTSVGAFIFIGIVSVIVYSILTGRAPKGDFEHGHPIRGDWRIETLWTVVPMLLVFWLSAQCYKMYQLIDIQGLTPIVHLHMPMSAPAYAATNDNKPVESNNAKPTSEEIQVVAKQWAWSFRYPGNVTSTELHLPVNQSVRLAMTSEDVLHGFYVPEFRGKQDIIPNRTITVVFTPTRTGKYRLRDSQFSGTYFSLMGADVYVESPEAYNQWLSEAATRKPAPAQNQAFSEYTQQPQQSQWPTVVPAPPPVVNLSS